MRQVAPKILACPSIRNSEMNKEGIKQISTWEKLLKIKEIAEKEIDSKDEESLLEKKYKEEIKKCKFSEKYRCFERPENCSRSLEKFKVPHLVK